MSVRPETLALLDRMFGDERSVNDALARIENAANELHGLLHHLETAMRETDEQWGQLLTDLDLTEDQRELVEDFRDQPGGWDLTKEARFSESARESEWVAIETATGEISKLAERWS